MYKIYDQELTKWWFQWMTSFCTPTHRMNIRWIVVNPIGMTIGPTIEFYLQSKRNIYIITISLLYKIKKHRKQVQSIRTSGPLHPRPSPLWSAVEPAYPPLLISYHVWTHTVDVAWMPEPERPLSQCLANTRPKWKI